MTDPTSGVALIAAERHRQIEDDGYDAAHDRGRGGELAVAAACYAMAEKRRATNSLAEFAPPFLWPWKPRYWKPTPDDRVRELIKAGALIAAAIDALMAAKGATR